jgi:RluA family pseudouridine synthase
VATREIPLLYVDEHLLVADKPAGMLSVPTPNAEGRTLLDALRAQKLGPLAVHRLDRETSGAILFARDPAMRAALEEMFRVRAVKKTYWALARGRLRGSSGKFEFRIADAGAAARVSQRGQPAETRWRVLAQHPAATEVEVDLLTGRHNQIRLHFAHAGHPLVGERKYARGAESPLALRSRRVALHAWRLAFAHPRGGARIAVEAPLPADLAELRLRAAEQRRGRIG